MRVIYILLILCLLQIGLLYFPSLIYSKTVLGVTIFITEISIGVLIFLKKRNSKNNKNEKLIPKKVNYFLFILIFFTLFIIANWFHNVSKNHPIEIAHSDIIPQIDTLATRFIHHQFPYQTIYFDSYKMEPTYMPLQWLPYIIPIIFHVDIRFFALLFFLISIAIISYFSFNKCKNLQELILLFVSISLLLILPFLLQTESIIFITVEEGVAAFYMLIPIFIAIKKYSWASFIICLCLLSRYSILFWVPLYILVLYWSNKKIAIQQFLIISVGFCMVYVLPFLCHDWYIFSRAYQYHSSAALGEWNHLNANRLPCHLFDGQGLAFLFYKMKQFPIEFRLKLLQKVHLIISFGFIVLSFIYYYFNKNRIRKTIFLLSTFLIYLTLFYTFIQIPYKYLFIVPVAVSISCIIGLVIYTSKKMKL